MIPVSNFCHKNVLKPYRIRFTEIFCECRSNQLTSTIFPLGRHLRFYVINFRKLINVHCCIYIGISRIQKFQLNLPGPVTDQCYVVLNFSSSVIRSISILNHHQILQCIYNKPQGVQSLQSRPSYFLVFYHFGFETTTLTFSRIIDFDDATNLFF